jgi:aryl-alcohol dehydrogenase-like predicted oxidoreductase
VRAGKIRHAGLSDVPAWYAAEMQALAGAQGYEPVSSIQLEYSLVERNIEREHVSLALARNIGITVWSPLASGLLSGKYRTANTDLKSQGRLGLLQRGGVTDPEAEDREEGPMEKLTQRNLAIAAELEMVASELGRSMAQVAINWVANRPAVASVILGATRLSQLEDNLHALDFAIPAELQARLDRAGRIRAQFPGTFFTDEVQRRMSGGALVSDKPAGYWGL